MQVLLRDSIREVSIINYSLEPSLSPRLQRRHWRHNRRGPRVESVASFMHRPHVRTL